MSGQGNRERGTGNVTVSGSRVASPLSLVLAGQSLRLHVLRSPFPVPALGQQA
jgi:hypothetical protein